MNRQQVREELTEKIREVISYLEDHFDYDALYEEGLLSMIHTRYKNALSLLCEKNPGHSRVRGAVQFLFSANRAYVGDTGNLQDPLRTLLMEADKLVDTYLHEKESH